MNIDKPGDYFLIPVGICYYVLIEKKVRPFQVYMALKLLSSGTIKIDLSIKKKIATQLGVTVRTVETEIKKLLNWNWIGSNGEIYFLRSFNHISQFNSITSKIGVEFIPKDLKSLKAFLIGAVIGHWLIIKHIKHKRETRRRLGFQQRGNRSTERHLVSYPLSNSLLAKMLSCSTSTASQYKNEALASGYIDVSPQFIRYPVKTSEINFFKKYQAETHSVRIRVKDEHVLERTTDHVSSLMRFKRRKKSMDITRGL